MILSPYRGKEKVVGVFVRFVRRFKWIIVNFPIVSWCPPFCLETAVTKITKPSHVENALYLDYLKSNTNAFVKNILGIRQHHVFYHLHQTRVHKVFYLYLFKRYKTPFVIVSGSSDLTTPSI
jgi:hypothetical protein